MSDSINATFDYAGGTIEVEISSHNSRIVFTKNGETVVIEDAYGKVFDFDHYNYTLLTGAARKSFEEKKAREYAIEEFGAWVVFASEELRNA